VCARDGVHECSLARCRVVNAGVRRRLVCVTAVFREGSDGVVGGGGGARGALLGGSQDYASHEP
jgi:hypothetical protein